MSRTEMSHGMRIKGVQSPLLRVDGIEAFKVMRKKDGGTLDGDVGAIIDQIIYDGFVVITAAGRNASGKGEILRGIYRSIKYNHQLQRWTRKNGIDFKMLNNPFALCMVAIELEGTPKKFKIPPGYNPATYTPNHLNRGSELQWYLYREHILPRLGDPKKATVALMEVSTLGCYPVNSEVPVQLKGKFNLGNSTFYNLAFDRQSAQHGWFYIMDRGDDIGEERIKLASLEFREWVFSEQGSTFKGKNKVLVRNQEGNEVDLRSLLPDEQERTRVFFRKCMASPAGVERYDPAMDRTKQKLYKQGFIPDTTDEAYYQFIESKLVYPNGFVSKDRFSVVTGKYLPGEITYDTTYFSDSMPATLYPQLLGKR